MTITQEEAIKLLQELIDEVDKLKRSKAFSTEHTRWISNTFAITKEVYGPNSSIVGHLLRLTWQKEGEFYLESMFHGGASFDEMLQKVNHQAYIEQLDTAKGILLSAVDQIQRRGVNQVYELPEANEIVKILDLAENKLRKAIREKPQDEKTITEKYEDLLIANDISYSREQQNIVYSSKAYIPDFSFPKINTALEIKFCGRNGREKEIISEINDDILAYKSQYANLIFVVYDTGFIRDIDKFKDDLETEEIVVVHVVKH